MPVRLKSFTTISGIAVKRFNFIPLPYKLAHISPSFLFYLLKHSPDVMIVYSSIPSLFNLSAILASKLKKIPLILYPQFGPSMMEVSLIRRMYYLTFLPIMLRLADYIVAASKREKKLYELWLKLSNVEVIYGGVKIPRSVTLVKIDRRRLSRYSIKPGDRVILTVGRVTKYKGVDFLIEALAPLLKSGRVKLLIVGPDGGFTNYCTKLAVKLSCKHNVIFTGKVDNEEMQLIYSAADIVVVPSRFEGYGRSVIEAWSYGKPVIVTKQVPASELVSSRRGIVINYGDKEALLKAVNRLLSDDKLREDMGRAGFSFVSKELTWDNAVNKLHNVILKVLNKRR